MICCFFHWDWTRVIHIWPTMRKVKKNPTTNKHLRPLDTPMIRCFFHWDWTRVIHFWPAARKVKKNPTTTTIDARTEPTRSSVRCFYQWRGIEFVSFISDQQLARVKKDRQEETQYTPMVMQLWPTREKEEGRRRNKEEEEEEEEAFIHHNSSSLHFLAPTNFQILSNSRLLTLRKNTERTQQTQRRSAKTKTKTQT